LVVATEASPPYSIGTTLMGGQALSSSGTIKAVTSVNGGFLPLIHLQSIHHIKYPRMVYFSD
jgi:hypothetical protein